MWCRSAFGISHQLRGQENIAIIRMPEHFGGTLNLRYRSNDFSYLLFIAGTELNLVIADLQSFTPATEGLLRLQFQRNS